MALVLFCLLDSVIPDRSKSQINVNSLVVSGFSGQLTVSNREQTGRTACRQASVS